MKHVYKLCFLGNGGVGKTTLIQRYLTGSFNERTLMTLGVDFYIKYLIVDGERVTIQVWDLGGEDRFRFLLPSYCRLANGAVFVYDVTSPRSVLDIGDWLNLLERTAGKIPVLLVGTKKDLESERKVSLSEAKEIGKSYDINECMEASAKTGENVELLFDKICQMVISKFRSR